MRQVDASRALAEVKIENCGDVLVGDRFAESVVIASAAVRTATTSLSPSD